MLRKGSFSLAKFRNSTDLEGGPFTIITMPFAATFGHVMSYHIISTCCIFHTSHEPRRNVCRWRVWLDALRRLACVSPRYGWTMHTMLQTSFSCNGRMKVQTIFASTFQDLSGDCWCFLRYFQDVTDVARVVWSLNGSPIVWSWLPQVIWMPFVKQGR